MGHEAIEVCPSPICWKDSFKDKWSCFPKKISRDQMHKVEFWSTVQCIMFLLYPCNRQMELAQWCYDAMTWITMFSRHRSLPPNISGKQSGYLEQLFWTSHWYWEGDKNRTRSSWLNCALRDDEAVYWVSIGHYEAVAVGDWWYWVSRGHTCPYILHKVEIWTGVTDAWRTDGRTDFER